MRTPARCGTAQPACAPNSQYRPSYEVINQSRDACLTCDPENFVQALIDPITFRTLVSQHIFTIASRDTSERDGHQSVAANPSGI